MKKLLSLLVLLMSMSCFAALPPGVVGKKIFEYPNQPNPAGTYLFLLDLGNGTYYNLSVSQLMAIATTNLAFSTNLTTIIQTNNTFVNTNVFISTSNAFFNNIYSTNITAVTNINNYDFTTNLYVTTNYVFEQFVTNQFVDVSYVTNLYVTTNINDTSIVTNLYVTTSYVTNLYVTTNIFETAKGGKLIVTNAYITNLFVTYITNDTSYITNLYVTTNYTLLSYTTNLFSTNIVTTNLFATYITNETSYITNLYVTTNYTFVSFTTNLYATTITNVTLVSSNAYITNLTVNNITNTTLITTNITIMAGGGLTNFNASPNTLTYWDVNDGLSFVPNGGGALTNDGAGNVGWFPLYLPNINGNGTNMSFWGTTAFDVLDVVTAYLTNTFVFKTNAVLSGDSNGQITNLSIGSGLSFSGNTLSAVGTAATPYASNVVSGGVLGTNTLSATAGANGWFLGQSNATPVWTINGGSISNLNGGTLVGGTKTVTLDASFLWPGDTLAATWTTNTPGAGSASVQSAGPTFKAWSISQTASNRWLAQISMPPEWDGAAVNLAIGVVSGTNSAVANAQTNVWSVSAAMVGTALGTAVTITNKLPVSTGLVKTNFDCNTITIAGTPTPGDYVQFQVESRAGNTPWSSTNVEYLVNLVMRYGVTNIQNNAIQWP